MADNFTAGVLAKQATTSIWPQQTSGTWVAPYNANVVWQNTSSNATYCSASSALKGSI